MNNNNKMGKGLKKRQKKNIHKWKAAKCKTEKKPHTEKSKKINASYFI